MTDYTELKRLAVAGNAVIGDVSVDITISSEPGPNQAEIDAVTAFIGAATPFAVLALIAENERMFKLLERMVEQYVPLTELEGVPGWSRVVELVEVVAERDQLRAEVAGLRTGYEAYERVNAELKAEVEGLRKDAKIGQLVFQFFDRMDDPTGFDPLENSAREFLGAVSAAIGKGEQS